MAPHNPAPNTRSGAWTRSDADQPWQRNAVERYGNADEPADPGFHTYATSDMSDPYPGDDRWPDNWPLENARQPEPVEEDEDDAPMRRDYLGTLLWAAGWFAVPLFALLVRAVLLSGDPDPSCLATGIGSCASPRANAVAGLIDSAPIWALALLSAVAVAAVLRWASESWRAVTIGFCAAVVAGAMITIVYNVG